MISATLRTAIYAGSFNPFHKGHLNILDKANEIFDEVIVAQGVNREKGPSEHSIMNLDALKGIRKIQFDGLLTTVLTKHNATLVRGLRSVTDLQEEMKFLRYLQDLKPTVRVIHIVCDAEFEHLASRDIRVLKTYGEDVVEKYLVR